MSENENNQLDLKNINQLLDYDFIVPDYQRGYRWTSIQVKQLLTDIWDFAKKENKSPSEFYCLQPIVVKKRDENKYEVIDGQQRLTTLFLLHWYLYQISDYEIKKSEFKNSLLKNDKSMFSYETRTSSSDFCDALMLADIDTNKLLPVDINEKNSFSKTIKNCPWYYLTWDYDPTIQAMLIMLDAIHEKFSGKKEFFDRLLNIDNPIITLNGQIYFGNIVIYKIVLIQKLIILSMMNL